MGAGMDLSLLRSAVFTHAACEGWGFGSHLVQVVRGTELLHGVSVE